jgi:hypothetical protein
LKPIEEVKAHLDAKIQEWKDHQGQYLLFYMVDHAAPEQEGVKVEIRKCWSDEIDQYLGDTHTFIGAGTESLPRFLKHAKSPNT